MPDPRDVTSHDNFAFILGLFCCVALQFRTRFSFRDLLEYGTILKVQPSAKREGFATVPGVSWSDVGALASVREELGLSILEPIAYPEVSPRVQLTINLEALLHLLIPERL